MHVSDKEDVTQEGSKSKMADLSQYGRSRVVEGTEETIANHHERSGNT